MKIIASMYGLAAISALFAGSEQRNVTVIDEATPDAVQPIDWLVPHFATAEGKLIMSIHALIIDTGSRRIIVDTCLGNDKKREIPAWNMLQTTFLADLEAAGYPRESFDTVLCTHLHTDHVGWNTKLEDGRWIPTFPNARYLIPAEDEELYRNRAGESYMESVLPVIEAGQAEMVTADHMLGDYHQYHPVP